MTWARWLRGMVAVLLEARTHKERIDVTRDVLVRDLREQSHVIRQYEQRQWSERNVQENLDLSRWQQLATEWSVLRKRHRDLWNDIADAYDLLARAKRIWVEPPTSAHLDELARRLSEAKL